MSAPPAGGRGGSAPPGSPGPPRGPSNRGDDDAEDGVDDGGSGASAPPPPPSPLDALAAGPTDRPLELPWPFPAPRGPRRERAARVLREVARFPERWTGNQADEQARQAGLFALAVPESHAPGLGLDLAGELRVLREVARQETGLALQLLAHGTVVVRTLSSLGTRGLQDRWLPEMARGTALAAYGWSEAAGGGDPSAWTSTARRSQDGEGWALGGGDKPWVIGARGAELFLLGARLEARPGAGVASTPSPLAPALVPEATGGETPPRLFLAERADGVRAAPVEPAYLGLERAGLGGVSLTGVRVDLDALLGPVDAGPGEAYAEAEDRATLGAAAVLLGLGERSLLLARIRAGEAPPRGRSRLLERVELAPLRERLVDADVLLRAAEATIALAAAPGGGPQGLALSAPAARLVAGWAAEAASRLAVDLLGPTATVGLNPALAAHLTCVGLRAFPLRPERLADRLGGRAARRLAGAPDGPRRVSRPAARRVAGWIGALRRSAGGAAPPSPPPLPAGFAAILEASGPAVRGMRALARDPATLEPSPGGAERRRVLGNGGAWLEALGCLLGQALDLAERRDPVHAEVDLAAARRFGSLALRQLQVVQEVGGKEAPVPPSEERAGEEDEGRLARLLLTGELGFGADRAGWF